MPEKRSDAAVVELAPNKIWVTGGKTPFQDEDSGTNIYENGEWSQGPNLPEPLLDHCMAKVDENTIILSGGETAYSYSEKVYLFDIDSETWTEIARMPHGQRFGHSCGMAQ